MPASRPLLAQRKTLDNRWHRVQSTATAECTTQPQHSLTAGETTAYLWQYVDNQRINRHHAPPQRAVQDNGRFVYSCQPEIFYAQNFY